MGINDSRQVSVAVFEPGADRSLMPEVSRKGNDAQTAILAGQTSKDGAGAINAAVINKDKLIAKRLVVSQHGGKLIVSLFNRLFLVEARYDDRYEHNC